jgi:uncharacterized membrane protein YcaP (DUF421 family)
MAAVIRAVFGYCFLIFIVRIVGRRPGKQISPFEFVFIFFAGGLALTAMVADDASLTNAFCTISTIAVVHFALAWARQRSQTFARVIDGTPLVLLKDDVMAMARDKGITSLDQIEYALLERNGEISVIKKSGQTEEEEE